MKIYFPAVLKRSTFGGVNQFLSSFIRCLCSRYDYIEVYDHTGRSDGEISVKDYGAFGNKLRKVILLLHMLAFPFKLKGIDHVVLNPSLIGSAMNRDLFYARVCGLFNVSYSIYFHGWNKIFAERIDGDQKLKSSYAGYISKSEAVFVLSSHFKKKLIEWGVPAEKIHLSKTMIDDDFIPDSIIVDQSDGIDILFLSRVVTEKGIFEVLKSFDLHARNNDKSCLTVAGAGEDLDKAKRFVEENSIPRVKFVGHADDVMKKKLFSEHQVYILPSYAEGMPISVFEAMAYGLTVITRPVGGIPDFFVNEKMGYLVDSLEPEVYSDIFDAIESSPGMRVEIAEYNREFVKNNAVASAICRDFLEKSIPGECLPK